MDTTTTPFHPAELDYLASQQLGRLASVASDGTPQNNPVGFRWNPDTRTIDIGGMAMGATRKWRNVREYPPVSLVVDDPGAGQSWMTMRGIEIRGEAEALEDVEPGVPGMSREIIRIHPRRIIAWGLGNQQPSLDARNVDQAPVVA